MKTNMATVANRPSTTMAAVLASRPSRKNRPPNTTPATSSTTNCATAVMINGLVRSENPANRSEKSERFSVSIR